MATSGRPPVAFELGWAMNIDFLTFFFWAASRAPTRGPIEGYVFAATSFWPPPKRDGGLICQFLTFFQKLSGRSHRGQSEVPIDGNKLANIWHDLVLAPAKSMWPEYFLICHIFPDICHFSIHMPTHTLCLVLINMKQEP